MVERRTLLSTGRAAGVGALLGANPASGAAAQSDDTQNSVRIARAIDELRESLERQAQTAPALLRIRDQQRTFLKANHKFPDFVEVGIGIWEEIYDWHVGNQQPPTMRRAEPEPLPDRMSGPTVGPQEIKRMRYARMLVRTVPVGLCIVALGCGQPPLDDAALTVDSAAAEGGTGLPEYTVDPFWPKTLPNDMLIGRIAGVAVDSQDRIFVVQRPGSLTPGELGLIQDPARSLCCRPAPPVLVFDADGNLVDSWGGPGEGYDWPGTEHGIYVDHNDNAWLGGEGIGDPETLADHSVHGEDNPLCRDHFVLKFSNDGEFIMQIGEANKTQGSTSTEFLGHPADIEVDPETNEAYVADGYLNKRVIVFDADTGEYKRHWGAYGRMPDDNPMKRFNPDGSTKDDFTDSVHGLRISNDGLVYVADRGNGRIQIFQKDGTYVEEHFIEPETRPGSSSGTVWDIELSNDEAQTYLYVADGTNQRIWTLQRDTMEVLDSFGRRGRGAGEFHWLHKFAIDSQGNFYTGEVHMQRRLQKFVPQTSAAGELATAHRGAGTSKRPRSRERSVQPMKAVVLTRFGSPEALRFKEVEKPGPNDKEVLLKVHATAINDWDWQFMRGRPLTLRPRAKPP